MEIPLKELTINTVLEIPFELKHIANANKLLFDKDLKKFVISEHHDNYNEIVELFEKVYLKNDFELKDTYKANNGKWDIIKKKWYTYKSNVLLFEHFI